MDRSALNTARLISRYCFNASHDGASDLQKNIAQVIETLVFPQDSILFYSQNELQQALYHALLQKGWL